MIQTLVQLAGQLRPQEPVRIPVQMNEETGYVKRQKVVRDEYGRILHVDTYYLPLSMTKG